jgi:hypothetical protein
LLVVALLLFVREIRGKLFPIWVEGLKQLQRYRKLREKPSEAKARQFIANSAGMNACSTP